MRILEATRAHLECIFGLYEDPDGEVLKAIVDAPTVGMVHASSDEGVCHELEPITDEDAQQRLIALLEDRKVWIADGHHRYETALAYRQNLGAKDHLIPEDFLMMALCSISDPGLVLLPTHRILKSSKLDQSEIASRLSKIFDLSPTASSLLMSAIEESHQNGKRAFGLAFAGGTGYVLTEKNSGSTLAINTSEESDSLKALDVTVLHRVIFETLLDIQGLDNIAYTRDAEEAIRSVDGGAVASFLMNPPSVADMQEIALGGEKMPQKSTYYYPKILSGLVIWSLNDF